MVVLSTYLMKVSPSTPVNVHKEVRLFLFASPATKGRWTSLFFFFFPSPCAVVLCVSVVHKCCCHGEYSHTAGPWPCFVSTFSMTQKKKRKAKCNFEKGNYRYAYLWWSYQMQGREINFIFLLRSNWIASFNIVSFWNVKLIRLFISLCTYATFCTVLAYLWIVLNKGAHIVRHASCVWSHHAVFSDVFWSFTRFLVLLLLPCPERLIPGRWSRRCKAPSHPSRRWRTDPTKSEAARRHDQESPPSVSFSDIPTPSGRAWSALLAPMTHKTASLKCSAGWDVTTCGLVSPCLSQRWRPPPRAWRTSCAFCPACSGREAFSLQGPLGHNWGKWSPLAPPSYFQQRQRVWRLICCMTEKGCVTE